MSLVSTQDLGIAYRKAKVDLFYASHSSMEAIADYEANLEANLCQLAARINGDDETWLFEEEFLGTWMLAEKSISTVSWNSERKNRGPLIIASPDDEWKIFFDEKRKPTAEFRVMSRCSLDFHVLSTLWILRVGQRFDLKLSESAYGNRLRRGKDRKKINRFSLGTFKSYHLPFRNWRENGIKAMREALSIEKSVVALTADIDSFYHMLNPRFLIDTDFVSRVLKIKLTPPEQKINRLFINALDAWGKTSPLKKGLPVGLPASALVANVALIELDRAIEYKLNPIYYGRYVDDIILVMKNTANFQSVTEIWNWVINHSDEKLSWVDNTREVIRFSSSYLNGATGSKICFSNHKNKAFLLTGNSGLAVVDSIDRQIRERASEWRAMPRVPESPENVGTDLLAAIQSNGETADNLRKTDSLTMRRANFAIKLRDFEAYERELEPSAWANQRRAFCRAFIDHVLKVQRFFDLSGFLPRVIKLFVACEDFDDLNSIILAIKKLIYMVETNCEIKIAGIKSVSNSSRNRYIEKWKRDLASRIEESISSAISPNVSQEGALLWKVKLTRSLNGLFSETSSHSLEDFQARQARWFSFDLAHVPFRYSGLPHGMTNARKIPPRQGIHRLKEANVVAIKEIIEGSTLLKNWMWPSDSCGIPHGLAFPTRPFSLPELSIIQPDLYLESRRSDAASVVLSTRGFNLSNSQVRTDGHLFEVPEKSGAGKFCVAVSSWMTRDSSWIAAAANCADPDSSRYSRLCQLLDSVISQPDGCRYLVLPELALPARWFILVAKRLQRVGISLITGIQYIHDSNCLVRNQVWASLLYDGTGFRSMLVYQQDKQRPALHEEQELYRVAGLRMEPRKSWSSPPIIQHGDIRFSILVCSELTNIKYRADLRGKVDLLFVPEWNRDTESFDAIVESAALDIHAFIVQCNDRHYGDSRIRAPYKDTWRRDVVRVKGGNSDFFIAGEVDTTELRAFQSSHRSLNRPFKPVPDGFNDDMDGARRTLPLTADK